MPGTKAGTVAAVTLNTARPSPEGAEAALPTGVVKMRSTISAESSSLVWLRAMSATAFSGTPASCATVSIASPLSRRSASSLDFATRRFSTSALVQPFTASSRTSSSGFSCDGSILTTSYQIAPPFLVRKASVSLPTSARKAAGSVVSLSGMPSTGLPEGSLPWASTAGMVSSVRPWSLAISASGLADERASSIASCTLSKPPSRTRRSAISLRISSFTSSNGLTVPGSTAVTRRSTVPKRPFTGSLTWPCSRAKAALPTAGSNSSALVRVPRSSCFGSSPRSAATVSNGVCPLSILARASRAAASSGKLICWMVRRSALPNRLWLAS
ncbi:hypothetical protein CHKEEEPN_4494 [Methylorubrum podarium]|nr:hypothetical protein CHKEEEPN_4494 [Methylorubrum podarium]